jgi:hypothetical protein
MNKVDAFFDKLKRQKVLSFVIILGMIVSSVLGLYLLVHQFYKTIIPIDFSKELDISLSSFDPRNIFDGEKINWGGGSQAIFVNCKNNYCDTINKKNLNNHDFWEVTGYSKVQFVANLVYNAPLGAPTCIIDEWGVELTKDTVFQLKGLFYNYNNIGGADAPLEGGECVITEAEGQFVIKIWYDQNERINQPAKIHYFKPGDIIPLKVTLNIDNNYKGLSSPNTLYGADALRLRLYAKMTIDGKKGISYSKDYIKIVISNSNDNIQWRLNELEWDVMEEARKYTVEK